MILFLIIWILFSDPEQTLSLLKNRWGINVIVELDPITNLNFSTFFFSLIMSMPASSLIFTAVEGLTTALGSHQEPLSCIFTSIAGYEASKNFSDTSGVVQKVLMHVIAPYT